MDSLSISSDSFTSFSGIPENVGFATFFWHLYKTQKFTDVKLDLPGPEGQPVTFLAHKLVLSIWSPYFADKFHGENKDTNITNVKLDNVNPGAFASILKFMYGYHSASEIFNRENVLDLLKISMILDIPHLTQSCHEFINSITLDVSNVFNILEAANDLQSRSLIDRCLKFLQDNTKQLLESYDICAISSSMLHTLLDLPKLCLPSEFDLLLWVFAWGKNRSLKISDCACTRDALEEFLPKMQFLSLSNKEFAFFNKHREDFFKKDEALSIFMNIGILGSVPLPNWYDKERPVREYVGANE